MKRYFIKYKDGVLSIIRLIIANVIAIISLGLTIVLTEFCIGVDITKIRFEEIASLTIVLYTLLMTWVTIKDIY